MFCSQALVGDRWEQIEGGSPRVYCLGKCYAAPASGRDESQPAANSALPPAGRAGAHRQRRCVDVSKPIAPVVD